MECTANFSEGNQFGGPATRVQTGLKRGYANALHSQDDEVQLYRVRAGLTLLDNAAFTVAPTPVAIPFTT